MVRAQGPEDPRARPSGLSGLLSGRREPFKETVVKRCDFWRTLDDEDAGRAGVLLGRRATVLCSAEETSSGFPGATRRL